jgi:hypothetical protein
LQQHRVQQARGVDQKMRISRDAIVEMLKERGLDDRASEAQERLPAVIETENDLGLLSEFGIAADDLVGGLGEVATDDKDMAPDDEIGDDDAVPNPGDDAAGTDHDELDENEDELDDDEREAAGDQQERR